MQYSSGMRRRRIVSNDEGLERVYVVREVVYGKRELATYEYLRLLWSFRQLFAVLTLRDIIVRYRNAALGLAWVLIRPILVILVFSQVFRALTATAISTAQYSITVLCAVPAWLFFSSCVQDSIGVIGRNAGILSKVFFPRMILVAGTIATNSIDFLVCLVVVATVAAGNGMMSVGQLAALPLIVTWLVVLVAGCSLWIAALNAQFSDVRNMVPFLLHLLIVLSPVGYSTKSLPVTYQLVLTLNPLTGILGAFRYALSGEPIDNAGVSILVSCAISIFVFISGFAFFKACEPNINDSV